MRLIWSIKEVKEIAESRQKNKYDFNIVTSGARGNGKSTFLFKLFLRFPQFKPWTHVIYSRKEVMSLLEGNQYIPIMDDEAINSGYKRNFYDKDQKLLIQMLNMYRDNFNIYAQAVPNFYALDKDLRDLIKIHVQIIERGIGVLHLPNEHNLYSDDKWDMKYNKKIEENWGKLKAKNPDFRPPYHKLSTFRGYIYFGDLTDKQRKLYEDIKKTKRKKVYDEEMKLEDKETNTIYDNILVRLLEKKLTKEILLEISLANNLKYRAVRDILNRMLTEGGHSERVTNLLQDNKITYHNNSSANNNVNVERLSVI